MVVRPEISAEIVNQNYYANANEAARAFVEPEILDDPIVYPPNEQLVNSEVYLPLSLEGEAMYREIWQRFLAAGQ